MRHRTGAETTTMKHEDPATGADGASSAPAPRPGPMLQIAAAATSGLAFGWALHKGGTFEPETIRAQFLFRDWTMMKMFLSAAASSTLAIQFMHLLPATRAAVVESSKAYLGRSAGLFSGALGGVLLGAGMAMSGSCPGTVYAQFGSGLYQAAYTFAGMTLGAAAYGVVAPSMAGISAALPLKGATSLNEALGLSRGVVATAVAVTLAFAIAAIDAVAPDHPYTVDPMAARWHPAAAGVVIGAAQLPITAFLSKNAGASSSYVTMLAAALYPGVGALSPYFEGKRRGMQNWWQVIYVFAAAAGSYAAMRAANEGPATSQMTAFDGLVGGFLAVFGARMANGCTSGHGISGFGHLSIRSVVTVVGMFAGAAAAAFALYQ